MEQKRFCREYLLQQIKSYSGIEPTYEGFSANRLLSNICFKIPPPEHSETCPRKEQHLTLNGDWVPYDKELTCSCYSCGAARADLLAANV